ncbi:17348_t:CDS:2, partial [Gigaspora margarita]
AQLKRKNSLIIECKTINYRVEKIEDIILVAKKSNRDNLTKVVIEEKMNIDCQTIFKQKKKPENIMLVNKKNNKLDVSKSIVEKKMNIDHQEILTQNEKEIVRKSARNINIEDVELSQHQIETEEEMEFDKDKEYVQQAIRDKKKGKYIEKNRSNTFEERKNLWKKQASRKEERYIEPRERIQKRREDEVVIKVACYNINKIKNNRGKLEALLGWAYEKDIENINYNSIKYAANKNLPKKKIVKEESSKKQRSRKMELHKTNKINKEIVTINKKGNCEVSVVKSNNERELALWLQHTKIKWKGLKAQEKIELKKQSEKEIRYAIDKRCERIDSDIGKILISLLEKSTNKIRIDRVLEQKENSWGSVNTPELVLEKTRDHFCEQFREREVVLDKKVFKEFYRPLKEKEERYIKIGKERVQAEDKKSLVWVLEIWLSSSTNERLLEHEVLSQQVVSLQNRLNSMDQVGKLTRLKVRQGYALA